MPVLKNAKHEAFAQNIAIRSKTGWTNTECYLRAGYTAEGNAAEACASKLLSSAKLRARIDEIIAPAVKKTRVTVDSLAEQFDAVFEGAVAAEQFGAAGTAAGLKAKLLGFMRDKIEVGRIGEFDKCQTDQDVAVAFVQGDDDPRKTLEFLDVLRPLLQERVIAMAHDVSPLLRQSAEDRPPPKWPPRNWALAGSAKR